MMHTVDLFCSFLLQVQSNCFGWVVGIAYFPGTLFELKGSK